MHLLALIILHPFRAAEKLRLTPRWLVAFLLICAAMVTLRIAWYPRLVEMTITSLPATATAEDRDWARTLLNNEALLRCMFIPVRQIAGMGSFAFLLFLLCRALEPPVQARFKQVLALEVHAEIFNLLGAALAVGIALLGGNEALLTSTKIFTLWYVVALTAGIVVLFGFSKFKACLLASTAWVISVLFNLFLLESVSTSMHFRL